MHLQEKTELYKVCSVIFYNPYYFKSFTNKCIRQQINNVYLNVGGTHMCIQDFFEYQDKLTELVTYKPLSWIILLLKSFDNNHLTACSSTYMYHVKLSYIMSNYFNSFNKGLPMQGTG